MNNTIDTNINVNKSNISSQNFRRRNYVAPDRTPAQKLYRIASSQGLIGKFFDGIQGMFGVKYSKRSLSEDIRMRNFKDIDSKLDKYYDRQKNETEMAIDLATGVTSAGVFKVAKKAMTYSHAN